MCVSHKCRNPFKPPQAELGFGVVTSSVVPLKVASSPFSVVADVVEPLPPSSFFPSSSLKNTNTRVFTTETRYFRKNLPLCLSKNRKSSTPPGKSVTLTFHYFYAAIILRPLMCSCKIIRRVIFENQITFRFSCSSALFNTFTFFCYFFRRKLA